MNVRRIVSGGQTGVDRAALDVARELGLEHGGHCPRGRRAEDGRIPSRYELQETASAGYAERTGRNVEAADATLVLHRGPLLGGTALTVRRARGAGRPVRTVDLGSLAGEPGETRLWLERESVRTLNVAGPRASQAPGLADEARAFLRGLLASQA